MESPCCFYPLRSVIRCIAKESLTIAPESYKAGLRWDQTLFNDLAGTLLQTQTQPQLGIPCRSRQEAELVEKQLARILVSNYCQILEQQENEQVQRLNALL